MATRPDFSLELLDLSSVPAEDLFPLLREERAEWRRQLLWEADDLTDVLELALTAGMLEGVAVKLGGRLVGYVSCHSARGVFRMCTAFLQPGVALAASDMLAEGVMRLADERGSRVEAQLTTFWAREGFDSAFALRGLEVTPRCWMVADLRTAIEQLGEGASAEAWEPKHLAACGELVHRAHEGSVEAAINGSFRSPKQARSYLDDVVRGPGCGAFMPEASSVVERASRVAGFAFVSRVGPKVAHLPQVAVAPEHQGEALGTSLLLRSFRRLEQAGHERVTLSVSRQNRRAAAWYARLGFEELLAFSSYHREP